MNAGRLLNGKRYGRWVKGRLGGWVWCVGGEYVSYVPTFKIASKILLGKMVCLSLS
jgi:hypothetical protein